MSLHKLAKITGYLFTIIGILGFIPGITEEGLLLGVFQVDLVHNSFHILTGLVAFGMSRKDQKITRYFFQVAGLVYMGAALSGFAYKNQLIFNIMANNLADSWLHLGLSVAFLYTGFLYQNHRNK